MALVRQPMSLIPLSKIYNTGFGQPGIRPFADSDDESYFTAILIDDAVIVTSEAVTAEVFIYIEDATGSIVACNASSMTVGTEIELPVTNLSVGTYTLYIVYGEDALAGDFEL